MKLDPLQDLPDNGNHYILVDFDRTLAHYESWEAQGTALGPPVAKMVRTVQSWLAEGWDVRIFTARAHRPREGEIAAIEAWCDEHIGVVLPIQNWKCYGCRAIYDDLAAPVEANTGEILRPLI